MQSLQFVFFLISSTDPSIECNTAARQPSVEDCDTLTAKLIELDQTFAVPLQSSLGAVFDTCLHEYGKHRYSDRDLCLHQYICMFHLSFMTEAHPYKDFMGQDAVTACFELEPLVTLTLDSVSLLNTTGESGDVHAGLLQLIQQ